MVKKCFAALLPLVLLFFLAGCLTGAPAEPTEPATRPTAAPTEKPTEKPTEAPTEKPTEAPTESITPDLPEPGPVSQEELCVIEEYLNKAENNGFVGINCYDSPAEIQLLWVFHNGAGIQLEADQWADGEAEAVLKALGWSKFHTPPAKIPREAANALLVKKCGLSLEAWKNFPYSYVEAYDAYYYTRSEEMRFPVIVESGEIDENGQYIIRYAIAYECPTGDTYTVTLRKTYSGYQFISNVEEYNPDPYPLHEISANKITVDGDKKTYKGAYVTLSVPVDWLALEQHFEDFTNYYFKEPTLDRCQLTFSSTGSEYARERTEAEYLERFSHLENVKILSYTKKTLSGFGCTKVVYSYSSEGTEYIGTLYDNVITGLCMYEFAIVYPTAESARLAPVFDAIVDSITVQPY